MKRLLLAPLLISGLFSPAIAEEQKLHSLCLQANDYRGCMEFKRSQLSDYQIGLDIAAPDPDFCRQYGASAFVTSTNTYTTINPTTSFVSPPSIQPACVIRRENWTVLQKQGAINNEDVRECKQRMNTFAYIGSIRDQPIVRCVYQADVNENKFIIRGAEEDAVGINKEAIQF